MSTIDTAYSIGQHQLKSMWSFDFDRSIGGVGGISERVRSVSFDFETLTVGALPSGVKFYESFSPSSEATLELYETVDFQTRTLLNTLRANIYNRDTGKFVQPRDVRGGQPQVYPTGILTLFGNGGNESHIYRMERMRLISVTGFEFNYEDAGPLIYTATFNIEIVREEFR